MLNQSMDWWSSSVSDVTKRSCYVTLRHVTVTFVTPVRHVIFYVSWPLTHGDSVTLSFCDNWRCVMLRETTLHFVTCMLCSITLCSFSALLYVCLLSLWFLWNRIVLFRHETKFWWNFAMFRRNFVSPRSCFVSFWWNFVKIFGDTKLNKIY